MTLLICICDFWQQREYLQITKSNQLEIIPAKTWCTRASSSKDKCSTRHQKLLTLRRLRLVIDGISVFYLLREIHEFTEFRLRLNSIPALRQMQLLWIQIKPPQKEIIDFRWNYMLAHTLWEKIEVDYLMSWLSTLGGGYSALGEQFSKCAVTAGNISLRQLSIGMRLGDPFVQARCKLYYSISLIQTGRLKAAKHIVREQYKFAIKLKEIDGRLVKMCKGIWLRIQYEYGLRIKEKERQKQLMMAAGDK